MRAPVDHPGNHPGILEHPQMPGDRRLRDAEVFDGRSQLLIYHFMFGPTYEAGCPVCSSIADTIAPNAVHLAAQDVTMLFVSRGPVEKLKAYKKRMGWGLDWASAGGSDFNR